MKKYIAAGLICLALILIMVACFSYLKSEGMRERGNQLKRDFHRALYDERRGKRFPIERLYKGE